jgi:hypothetical protein
VKNALDLAPIDVLVRVNPIGDFSEVAGPDILPIEKNGIFDRASVLLGIGPRLDLGNIRAHCCLRESGPL